MIQANYSKVRGDEKIMYGSVDIIDDMLEEMKGHHPDKYWEVMRSTHELMNGKHFDKHYAKCEVERMSHIGDDGRVYDGEHWSLEQTNAAMARYRNKLPSEVNEYDFYVALNAHWHDTICTAKRHFQAEADAEAYVIDEAVAVWFADRDWPGATKVWDYFSAMAEAKH